MTKHGETIRVKVMPQAAARMGNVIQPFLERSFATFLKNARKDVVSEYLDRTLIVVTTQANGETLQIALMRQEIPDLPPKAQAQLKIDLAIPAQVGTFTVDLAFADVAVVSGHHMTVEDGQHRLRPIGGAGN